ncbi:hypothetical protein RFI_09994, partial [Reticulomyxa filosa]
MFALMWESVLGLIEILIFFGPLGGGDKNESKVQSLRINDYRKYQNSVSVHLFLLFNSYCIGSLVEEMTKGFILQHCCKLYLPFTVHLRMSNHFINFILLGLAVGSGFGSAEAILYVCIYAGEASFVSQLSLLLFRLFVTIPFHSLLGVLWGLELSKREILGFYDSFSWFKMGWKPVFFHGTYDFLEMEYILLVSKFTNATMGWIAVGTALLCPFFFTYKQLVH